MTPEIVTPFIQANFAFSGGLVLAMLLRKPVRRTFGARIAYGVWMLAPMAALASRLPPRVVERPAPAALPSGPPLEAIGPSMDYGTHAATAATTPDINLVLAAIWAAGFIVTFLWLARRQVQFLADAAVGAAGPAVVGVFRPRIVTPSDFEERFTPREQAVVLAHEMIHLNRHDARINALVALVRCLCWYNPLVHFAAKMLRIDQELACDAVVLERHPRARRPYAEALLKAQLAARPLPLGCYWPAGTEHPLTERIAMLKSTPPAAARRLIGIVSVTLAALSAACAAWAVMPARIEFEPALQALSPAPRVVPAAPRPAATMSIRLEAASEKPVQLTVIEAAPAPVQAPTFTTQFPPDMPSQAIVDSGQWKGAFAQVFDGNAPMLLRGSVIRVELKDPYSSIYMRAEDGSTWRVLGGSVSGMIQNGVDPDSLKPGDQIVVRGYQSKDKACAPTCFANGRDVAFSDGRKVFVNPNGTVSTNPPCRAQVSPSCASALAPPARGADATPASASRFAGMSSQSIVDSGERFNFNDDVFDVNTPVALAGTITRIDMRNPNVSIYITDDKGMTWRILGGTPNTLARNGFPGTFNIGSRITVRGHQSKDKACAPTCFASGRDITFPDGSRIFYGSSGTGAPRG